MSDKYKRIIVPSILLLAGMPMSAANIRSSYDDKVAVDSIFGKTQNVEEVYVIGKTKARQLQEQAYAITVLDMKNKYSAGLPLNKVLNTVSSVRVREDGGVGSNYTFNMNGFSGNQVKFFLDGIPMDNFGSSFNLSTLSANIADRVEIYKGVLPVSLGADALGGAVNIVSRQKANYLDATYSIGSFNTHKISVNGAYTDVNTGFTFRANVFLNHSRNNYKVWAPIIDLNTNETLGERWVKRFHDQYNSSGFKFETGVVGQSWADYLLLGAIISGNDKDIQTGATMDAVYGGAKSKSISFIPSIRYKKDDLFVSGLSLSIYGTYNIINTTNVDTLARRYNWLGQSVIDASAGEGYLADASIHERQLQGNVNVNYVIGQHQSVTLNDVLTSMHRKQTDRMYPDYEMNGVPQMLTKNVMGLGYLIRFNKWNANIFGKMYNIASSTNRRLDEYTDNARWEKVHDSKHQFGYGAAATYFILPYFQFKASFEQAYRMPEAIEMFGDGFLQKSNSGLRPENSKNINVGLGFDKVIDAHRIVAEANFIYRYTKDFILKGVSLTSDPTTAYDNIGKVMTKGVEGSLRYSYKDIFHVGGNMTFQDIKDKQKYENSENTYVGDGITENITYGQRLPNIPYFFINGDMGINIRNFGVKGNTLSINYDMDYIYKYYLSFPGLGSKGSKKVIPEQFSNNASVGYSMSGGKYEVTIECTNITNEKLYDNYRLQKPGRAFNLKFRFFISK